VTTTHLGTPEDLDPPAPVHAEVTRIDLTDETWWRIRVEMTEPVRKWIEPRAADRCTFIRLGDRHAAFIGVNLAHDLHAEAGRQMPVTHEVIEVHSCLGNIINRFEDY
jgi:hypothetical protein